MKMKIEFEKQRQVINFGTLDAGTVFKRPSYDTVYMKTECVGNDGYEINSIDLSTGELDCFYDDTKVYAVDATLYVKEG